jgi:hypothetical protein
MQLANWKDVRLVMNRAVVKQHERLLRQNKPDTAMDNREARMQALKANDFAAYQAMLKATQGDAAALDDRCATCHAWHVSTLSMLSLFPLRDESLGAFKTFWGFLKAQETQGRELWTHLSSWLRLQVCGYYKLLGRDRKLPEHAHGNHHGEEAPRN